MSYAVDFSLAQLADIINRAFKGYVGGEVNFTPQSLAGYLMQSSVNLNRSLVSIQDDQPTGIALMARRGAFSRVALMGIVADYQGQGVGKTLMQQVISEARERGDRLLELEVIEQNPRAVRLYESSGFTTLRRLFGYSGENLQGTPGELTPIDITEAARHISSWAQPDLPWQLTGETLIMLGPPHVAYQMGEACAIVTNPEAETLNIMGIAVPPDEQRQGMATRLVSALIARHPGKQWGVPAIYPEALAPIFTHNGFTAREINQFQMRLPLEPQITPQN